MNFLSPIKILTKPAVGLLNNMIGEHPWVLFVLSLILLMLSLVFMVKSLKRLVVERAEAWFDRHLFKNAWRAFLVGIFLTCMVQSSSITTSLVVPMAGAGLLTIGQIFPYTLGANIGTTITAILAALVTGNLSAIIVAFSHLIFNISGIVIWWPLKVVPIILAQHFATLSTRRKFIPVLYIIFVFFIIPITLISFFR